MFGEVSGSGDARADAEASGIGSATGFAKAVSGRRKRMLRNFILNSL